MTVESSLHSQGRPRIMELTAQQAMTHYAQAYQKLYNRPPADARALDQDWVVVNGARMRANELEYLTQQLCREYDQVISQRKNMVKRLLAWFKQ
jgi:hypothetical protein